MLAQMILSNVRSYNIYHAGGKMSSNHLAFSIFSSIVAIALSEGDLIQDILEKMQDAGAR